MSLAPCMGAGIEKAHLGIKSYLTQVRESKYNHHHLCSECEGTANRKVLVSSHLS